MAVKPKQTFFIAFSPPFGNYQAQCSCGKAFYCSHETTYEEVEELKKSNATALDHGIGFVEFEGRTYVWDCDCWHSRASVIQNFIDGHFEQIANYMNAEIKRKQDEAISLTTMKVG